MSTRFFTNRHDNTLLAKFAGVFANNPDILFTESAETAAYLKTLLETAAPDRSLLCIDSSNRNERRDQFRTNFDANLEPQSLWRDDVAVLITTEVLAEGVNLHRTNTVVNYDTPWNATRLMQRLGRVNRIGATAAKISNYVFFPTSQVDDGLNLYLTPHCLLSNSVVK